MSLMLANQTTIAHSNLSGNDWFNVVSMISLILIGLVVIYIFVSWLKKRPIKQGKKPKIIPINPNSPISPKALLTEREKAMFRLLERVPNTYIFIQVSLGAILDTPTWEMRNQFIKKIADFVITDKNFNILAVIELDDKSHDSKKDADAFRDRMVKEAGYKVLRYPNIPKLNKIKQDLANNSH